MLCVSLFIIKCFQSAQKINFLKERKFGSMLYFVLCNLKFRLISCEFFSIVSGKGLCEGLLTKRFTTTKNLNCEREHMFLGIFTSMPVISVCHTVQ